MVFPSHKRLFQIIYNRLLSSEVSTAAAIGDRDPAATASKVGTNVVSVTSSPR